MAILSGAFDKLLPRHGAERRSDPRPAFPIIGQNWVVRPRRLVGRFRRAAIAFGQGFSDRQTQIAVAPELLANPSEERLVGGALRVNAGLVIATEAGAREVGAADDRIGLGAGPEIEDLGMEAARPVLAYKRVRDEAVNKIRVGR